MFLLISAASALDCAGLNTESCDAANALAAQINQVAGSTVISDGAALQRFRTRSIYDQVELVRQAAAAGGCETGGVSLNGSQGGTYDTGPRTWLGTWDELVAPNGDGSASGGILLQDREWTGAYTGSEAGDFGTVYAVYNDVGQVAGDREGDFFMGIWRRTAGRRGVYATVWGQCAGSISAAFDGWYVGDLPDDTPPGPPEPQGLTNFAATFSQGGFSVAGAIDGSLVNNTGWAINPQEVAQTAVFEIDTDTPAYGSGTEATFELHHAFVTEHLIGCFELSVTTADRTLFADGLASGGLIGAPAIWTPVDVISAVASNGATMTVSPAGRIVVQDLNSTVATYTVVTETALTGLTGMRLDVCEDPSLPGNGPGTQNINGNFVLTEIELSTRAR